MHKKGSHAHEIASKYSDYDVKGVFILQPLTQYKNEKQKNKL